MFDDMAENVPFVLKELKANALAYWARTWITSALAYHAIAPECELQMHELIVPECKLQTH